MFLGLESYELWIILIGSLVCSSCGIVGCFLVLRRMALMGDAISHAVLPGIVIAVMITGSLSSIPILIGAGVLGVLTPFLTETLKRTRRVHADASLGAIFTFLFAIGVILVTNAGNIDLDTDCVLYGEIALTPFDGGRSLRLLLPVFLLDVAFVTLLFKELKLSTFDEGLAASMGLRPRLIHYLLMAMVSFTTIASFESVGAIIVVAMLIAPGATAYLLTDRLGVMLLLSALIGVLSAALGYLLSLAMGSEVSISGSMAAAVGFLFGSAFLFGPRHGVLPRVWRRRRLRHRLMEENLLIDSYRQLERGRERLLDSEILGGAYRGTRALATAVAKALANGTILREGEHYRLTKTGRRRARDLLRAHRLWEAYIHKLGLPPDHVHRSADEMEHYLSPELQRQLEKELGHPTTDPQGKPIPERPE